MPMKNIVIFSGALDNIGDLALLKACVEGLRRYHDFSASQIWSYNWGPVPESAAAQLKSMGVIPISGKSFQPYALMRSDTLLLWGGGQLLRNNASMNSLRAARALIRLATLRNAKTAVIGCGVSSLSPDRKKRYRRIFKNSDLFLVRDADSADRAAPLLNNIQPIVTEDLAFSYAPLWTPRSDKDERRSLLIAPCEDTSENRTVNTEQIHKLINAAQKRYANLTTEFISHDVRPQMDPLVCAKLGNDLARHDIATTHTSSLNLAKVLRTYERAHLVVTNRMHAAIFAYSRGCAVLMLDDGNPKTNAVVNKLSLATIPVTETRTFALENAIDRAEKIKSLPTTRESLNELRTRSEANFSLLSQAIRNVS